jgi:hypothetical protein
MVYNCGVSGGNNQKGEFKERGNRMKKAFFIGILSCCLLSSCAAPPEAVVRTILDIEKEITTSKVVIVSDAGKRFGKAFGQAFSDEIRNLTQESDKDISFMTYMEFIRSPYNNPDKQSSFSDTLFVFIQGHSVKSGDYGIYSVKYLMDVNYLDQAPFISQEITIEIFNQPFGSKSERGCELAQTVFEELRKRAVL